ATFAYEEIAPTAAPVVDAPMLAAAAAATAPVSAATPPGAADPAAHPMTSEEAAGHRLVTLVFDTSSMQPEEVQKAVDGARVWVATKMTPADLVAVAAIGSSLQVVTDFTSSRERVRAALSTFSAVDGTAYASVDSSTASTDEANQAATSDATAVDQSVQ